LRHQLELELAGAVLSVEMPGIRLAREGANDFAHTLRLYEGGEAGVAVTGIVIHDGELTRPLRDERVDEGRRHARVAEAMNHYGGAVWDVGQGGLGGADDFIDHGFELWHSLEAYCLFRFHMH
jgi:hypothetical protein